jgi:Tfp pilus assembly protein PilN
VKIRTPRLGVALLGDRLAAVAVRAERLEAFIVDSESPSATLRAELDARQLSVRAVALGLARTAVSVKPIDLPAVGGEVRDMVRFELERHLPFPADDAPFDFTPLPPEPDAQGGQRVLVAAADRRVMEAALRLADEARLRPSSLTVSAHDLVSLVKLQRRHRVAWAHRSAGGTDVLFLDGVHLVLSRNLGGTDDALLAVEIQKSVTSLRWRACDAVWLSGDGSAPEADSDLARLGAVTEPPYTPRALSRLAQLPEEGRGTLQLALGLASARRQRELDLLPTTMRPRRLTRSQLVTAGVGVMTLLLVITALLVPGYREGRHLARINAEIARVDPDVRAVELVVRELERKRKLLATVDGLERNGLRPLPVLRELTELLPNDAWLTTVSLDPKGVELTGQAAAASTLISILENSSRLERVEFSSPVTRGRDKEQFRIRAAWEPGGASLVTPAGAPAAPAAAPPGPPAARPAAPTAAAPAAPTAPSGPALVPGGERGRRPGQPPQPLRRIPAPVEDPDE